MNQAQHTTTTVTTVSTPPSNSYAPKNAELHQIIPRTVVGGYGIDKKANQAELLKIMTAMPVTGTTIPLGTAHISSSIVNMLSKQLPGSMFITRTVDNGDMVVVRIA